MNYESFERFLDFFKCFWNESLATYSTLRAKLQIKEVDSVTKIIKSHQKVSLRTILHVNIIIKSLRLSAIGYFLTIITIRPIESHQKNHVIQKNHLISLSSCDVEWPSRRAYNQISIQILKFIHLNRNHWF